MAVYRRAYIPTCESYGWDGGPGFKTNIVMLANKHENANADWDQPQHFFSLPFQNIDVTAYTPIKQMHMNCRGMHGRFLYRDRLDSTVTDELLAFAESGDTTFQLGKWSVVDGISYFRHVYALYAPDPSSDGGAVEVVPIITINGTPTVAFTVDPERGIVVFDTPMVGTEEIRWSATSFSLWVRFDNDRLPFTIDNKTGNEFVVNGTVELLEMPPPPEATS